MLSMDTWNTSNEAINILEKDKYLHLWSDSVVPMRSVNAYGVRGREGKMPYARPVYKNGRVKLNDIVAENMFRLSETLASKTQNCGLIDETIDGGDSLCFGREEMLPAFETGVCGKQNRAFAMPGGDEPEEVFCGVSVKGIIAKFIEVEDIVFFVTLEGSGVSTVDEGSV